MGSTILFLFQDKVLSGIKYELVESKTDIVILPSIF